ncbi:hypothetical protein SAY86_030353 [Trapa natans]|uniref:Uncharacterized protein n=1 Tax=Trapa natans TaxID=22666 RepID=A0AAN7M4X1_TRANT|nr:hypothetical protein SAY86_030353 [Trapa natans]
MAPWSRIPLMVLLAVLVAITAALWQPASAQEAMASAPASEMTPGSAISTSPIPTAVILSSLLLSGAAILIGRVEFDPSDLVFFNQNSHPKVCEALHFKKHPSFAAMEMKKIACAVILAAASVSAVMAEAPLAAPAAAPTSGATASALPAVGSLMGASIVSLVAYCFY